MATPQTIKKWNTEEARKLSAIARHLFRCDVHQQHEDYKEHCGACALNRYLSDSAKADGMTESDGPNYAGWARCYVQAGRPIPKIWQAAFADELASDNRAYADALMRDIATFGVRMER